MPFPNMPTDHPRPKPTPRPPKPPPKRIIREDVYILGRQPKPHTVETQEFAAILTGVRERMDRLDEAESILEDIHDQLTRYDQIEPMTAARLRLFVEGK